MTGSQEFDDLLLAESALDGDPAAAMRVLAMLRAPEMTAFLRNRGAGETEAGDIIADLAGDCFGGRRVKGGLHRLLGRYNGNCPLPAFLRHVALNRLISLKRRNIHVTSTLPETVMHPMSPDIMDARDDSLISLLREALLTSVEKADAEQLVILRLIESYGIPQKLIGELWGWHEAKVSRMKHGLLSDLRESILREIRRREPWLHLEWEDFLALCGESSDLFSRRELHPVS